MAEKTVFQKMHTKPGMTLRVIGLPEDLKTIYQSVDPDVILVDREDEKADILHLFVKSMSELEKILPGYTTLVKPSGAIWICYPKLSSTIESDLSRDIIWKYVEQLNFRPVAMVAMNDTWSAFRIKIP
jgi:hypothetical protein